MNFSTGELTKIYYTYYCIYYFNYNYINDKIILLEFYKGLE
jgi:hypothetical protein